MATPKPKPEDLREMLDDLAVVLRDTAKSAGISRTALYDAVNGRWMLRPPHEKALAQALGVTRERLRAANAESCRRAGNQTASRRRPAGKSIG